MPDLSADWRRALQMLAGSATGCTASLLSAHGIKSEVVAGLVDCGLATSSGERVLAGERSIEVTRFKITDAGRAVLER
jgi:hypothetical protein